MPSRAKVVALMEGVLKAMLMTKIKVALAVVMTLNLIGAGVGLVYCQTAGTGQPGKGEPERRTDCQSVPPTAQKTEPKKEGPAAPAKDKLTDTVEKLIADSKKKLTLMESKTLTNAKLGPEDVRAAQDYIKEHKDYTSYHLLFALPPDDYKKIPNATKADILVSALGHLIFLNDWGHLPAAHYDGKPAKALLETKKEAIAPLKGLLDDRSEAPFCGSKDATTSSSYGYRRCDFAYRYLSLILGRTPAFPTSPEERDKLIARLKEELNKDKPDDEKKQGGADSKVNPSVPPAKADAPQPLPENIVKAWEEAQAQVGWMRVHPAGFLEFARAEEGKPGDLPAFLFHEWQDGRLAKLPAPASAFGLYLNATQVTDAELKELAGLKSLQALNLGWTKVTDAGLKELAGLKSLQALDLVHTQVTDAGLKELAGLKSLQALNLYGTQVTDAGLKELAGLKSLQTLTLNLTQVRDAGLKELAGLKSLQALDLGWTRVTDAGLKELAGLKSLQALVLGGTEVTDAGLKELTGLKSLQTLDLGSTHVTDAGLKELAGLKTLQALLLYATQVTDAGLKELAGLKSLQTLDLVHTQVTDAGLKELAGLKSLQSLDLRGTQVTDAGLKELAGLKSLQTLNLNLTQVTDAGLKELAGLKSLQALTLDGTQVTDAGLKELAGLKSLQAEP